MCIVYTIYFPQSLHKADLSSYGLQFCFVCVVNVTAKRAAHVIDEIHTVQIGCFVYFLLTLQIAKFHSAASELNVSAEIKYS